MAIALEAVSKLSLSLWERAGVRENCQQPMHPRPTLSQRARVLKLLLVFVVPVRLQSLHHARILLLDHPPVTGLLQIVS
jgi:hypothetical protein